jgi:hypothetical protein
MSAVTLESEPGLLLLEDYQLLDDTFLQVSTLLCIKGEQKNYST